MRKRLLLVVSLVLVAAVMLVGCQSDEKVGAANGKGLVASQGFLASSAGDNSQQTGIWVSGTGTVTAAPDVAILSLGVESQAVTVTEAQSDAVAAMVGIMAALDANGVAEKDIQTQRYSISVVRKWDEDYRKEITIGYRVTNIVTAKIRDIDKTGIIIDAVAEAGGDLTRIESIGFTVDDSTAYNSEAREQAVLDAMAKAEQIASTANVILGRATYISESGGYIPTRYPAPSFAGSLDESTPISPGEMEITITVQMGFAIQ